MNHYISIRPIVSLKLFPPHDRRVLRSHAQVGASLSPNGRWFICIPSARKVLRWLLWLLRWLCGGYACDMLWFDGSLGMTLGPDIVHTFGTIHCVIWGPLVEASKWQLCIGYESVWVMWQTLQFGIAIHIPKQFVHFFHSCWRLENQRWRWRGPCMVI